MKTENKTAGKTAQKLNAVAVCYKQTGEPAVIVVGDAIDADNYLRHNTSLPLEQFRYVEVAVVVGGNF